MFRRLGIGSYAGGAVALMVFFFANPPARTVRIIGWAIPVVAAMAVVQGLFLP